MIGARGRTGRARLRAGALAALLALASAGPALRTARPLPQSAAARFVDALAELRTEGDDAARAALAEAARELANESGRDDAVAVAAYYAGLDEAALAGGLRLEARFDALRAAAAEGDLGARDPRLAAFHREARAATDVVPAAHAASLRARLLVRALEDAGTAAPAEVEAARRLALEAVRRFARAGQRTPALEARWVLARGALLAGDLDAAAEEFGGIADLARELGRDAWRERGLVGAIGVARRRGDAHAAMDLVRALARFRSPDASWSLAREVAVQLVSEDRPDAARRWLDAHPPSEIDPEIDLAGARSEWRALAAAAELRRGAVGRAEALLVDVPGDDARLMRAAIALELGAAGQALAQLEGLDAARRARIDAVAMEGRARLALGDVEGGVGALERALALAARQDGAADRGRWLRASALGESLGLTAVLDLGEARLGTDGALEAAATIEGAVACVPRGVARARLLALASATDLGAVTFTVAADRALAIHVAPDGSAVAHRIPRGRLAVRRAARRLVADALASRDGGPSAWTGRGDALAREVAETLLPPRVLDALDRGAGGALALLPHGAAEEVPFELLPVGDVPLGVAVALWITPSLRADSDLAPAIDGRRARWVALGAPDLAGTDLDALPGARAELARLAAAHPGVEAVASGAEMSRTALTRALGGERPVHVATHVVEAGASLGLPTRGLVCAGGDVVTAADVAALRPRLPLVVLGACGSAEGELVDGLGLRGIAQAMLDAGTRAAVVTQWSVSDEHAERALLAFHASLLGGADPAEALRRARAALRRSGASPAEWAALRTLGQP